MRKIKDIFRAQSYRLLYEVDNNVFCRNACDRKGWHFALLFDKLLIVQKPSLKDELSHQQEGHYEASILH